MLVLQNVLGDYTTIKAQDVQIVDTLNSFQTLSFSFITTKENEVAAKMMIPMTVIEVPENKQKYRLLTANTAKVGKYLQYSVTAVHVAKDMHRYYREERLPQTQSLKACLDFMFKGTPFSYVIDGDFPNFYFSEGFGENFVDELLTQCANDFKFEYYFDKYTLHIAKQIGKDNSFVFIDNVNCAKISVSENYESITTHIVGYSNPKQSDNESSTTETTYEQRIDYTSPIVNSASWPVIDATPVKYDQTLDNDTLLARMKASLQDYPQIQYTIDSVNFKRFTRIKNDIAVGNQGWLRNRFGIDVKTRISSITWYPQDPTKIDAITFGNVMLDPITWSVRNKRAFDQNVNLGRDLRKTLEYQQRINAEALEKQNEIIKKMQQQINELQNADNWQSGRLFVDLSSNNGKQSANWYQKLHEDNNVEGVMIKITESTSYINELFNDQREKAKNANIKLVGVYHYLTALSVIKAIDEANHFVRQIQAANLSSDIIVAVDVEDDILPKDKAKLTAIVQAFNKTVSDAGYTKTCDYAPLSWFGTRFESSAKYKWIASWGDNKPSDADAWQFTKNFAGLNLDCSRSYNKEFL